MIILLKAVALSLAAVMLFGAASETFAQDVRVADNSQSAIVRVFEWARAKVSSAIHWVREQGTKIARAFFGGEEQPIALNTEPEVLGETALSEDVPLDAPPPQGTVTQQPVQQLVVPEPEEEVVPPAPEPEPVGSSDPTALSDDGAEPTAAPDQTEPSPQTESPAETLAPEAESEPAPQSTSPSFIPILARDTVAPTSRVDDLPSATASPGSATSSPFTVSWSGADTDITGNPEVRSFDIQYQVDSGEWQDWLLETVLLSDLFTSQDEKTYGFRSRARDRRGNEEAYSEEAHTSIYSNLSIPTTPAVTSHASGATLLNTTDDEDVSTGATVEVTLSGTGDSGDTLTITLDETSTTATTTIDGTGWSQQFTLAEGANNFTLKTQEADGDFSNNLLFVLNLEFVPTREVVVNEIAWMGTAAGSSDEWLELYNASSTAIALTNWTLAASDNTPSITLSGTIPAKSYFLLERTDDNTVSTTTADVIYGNDGPTWALNNTGEALTLRNADGLLIDKVGSTTVDWFAGNNTTKATMERKDPTADGTVAGSWADNDGNFAEGKDANGALLKATPRSLNSVNTTIPRSVTDLQVQHIYTTTDSFRLYWTTPKTADLATTTPASYDLRYSTSLITESNFDSASSITVPFTPSATEGTVATTTASGLTASTTYYFALKTNNGVEDSGLSNVYTVATHAAGFATTLTGYSDANATLTVAGSPYQYTGPVTIPVGKTLTIQPGVVVKLKKGTNTCIGSVPCYFNVSGSLVIGSSSDSINAVVITSERDDAYAGDANQDVGGTVPAMGDWGRILLNSGASLTMNHGIVRYGGYNAGANNGFIQLAGNNNAAIDDSIIEYGNQDGVLVLGDSTLAVTDSTIQNNRHEGIEIAASTTSTISITSATFTGNRRGIFISVPTTGITLTGNNFFANNRPNEGTPPNAGVHFTDTSTTLTVADSWWGDASGPVVDGPTVGARDGAIDDENGAFDFISIPSFRSSLIPILPSGL